MEPFLRNDTQAFVIKCNALKGRFDVRYYKPKYREIVRRLKSGPFETKRLGDIVSLSEERWKKPRSGVFRYIEINDIDTFSGQIVQAKQLNVRDAPSRAQMVVRENDIIVSTTRPYRGGVALVTKEFNGCICSTGFAVIRELKTEINRHYLLRILHSNFGLKQMEQHMTGGNYPAITHSELLKIWIPIPPIEVQNEITRIMEEAVRRKEEMEKESDIISNSIDGYLLKELGIILPEFVERIPLNYNIGVNYLIRRRWDVEHWKPEYREVETAIKNGKYQYVVFADLIKNIVNGLDYRTYSEIGTKYLRVGNIKPFELDETDIKCIPVKLSDVEKDILLEIYDILLTRKGSFGNAIMVGDEVKNYIISSEVFRLVLTKDMKRNSYYIVSVLNSFIGKNQFSRKSIGAIMGSLSQKAVKSILIPFPPKPIQQKIATEIKSRIGRIKQLKFDAKTILETAKLKIERLIICGGNT